MPASPKTRIRFSLLNVVCLATFICMALALWQLYSELHPLRNEVPRLRNEAGYLTIDDDNQDCIHAIQLDTGNPLFWKWKVFLPDNNRDYCLKASVGLLPPKGKVPDKPVSVTDPAAYRNSHEQIVEISVINNTSGELVLRQQLGGISSEVSLDAEQEKILTSGSITWNGYAPSAGLGGTSRVPAGEPLTLLIQQRLGPNEKLNSNAPARGIIVWIEPVKKANSN